VLDQYGDAISAWIFCAIQNAPLVGENRGCSV
jgi:hypothetical protein